MSESEEMYLISIATLIEAGQEGPVPLSKLAETLSVVPVSANQMVKKLADANLVDYLPYKGVALTPAGERMAAKVLRHRRLWEFFLVEHLHIPVTDADALACRLEHITTDEVGRQLATFLGNPTTSPQGKPIPKRNGAVREDPVMPLLDLDVGRGSEVVQVPVEAVTSDFLEAGGVRPGADVTVLARDTAGSVLIAIQDRHINVAERIAAQIMVRK